MGSISFSAFFPHSVCSPTLPSHFPWSVTHVARSRLALHCTAYCQVLWTCNLLFYHVIYCHEKKCVTSVSHALISGLKIATSANIMQMHNISLLGLWPYSLIIPFSLLARMFRNSSSSFRLVSFLNLLLSNLCPNLIAL